MKTTILALAIAGILASNAEARTPPTPRPINCDSTPVGCRPFYHRTNPVKLPPTGVPFSGPPAGAPSIGTNDATVQANFPAVFLYTSQQNHFLDQTMSQWTPEQWSIMSLEYNRHYGSLFPLMKLYAHTLSVPNLLRAAAAFGPANLTPSVNAYSTPAIRAAYLAALPQVTPLPRSHWQIRVKGLSDWVPPSLKMTQTDLFYEAFAAQGATVQSALVSVAARDVQLGLAAYAFGYQIGGVIVMVFDKIDPAINIEIGNMIGASVDFVFGTLTQVWEPGITGGGYAGDPETGGWYDGNGNYFPQIPENGYHFDWSPTNCADVLSCGG